MHAFSVRVCGHTKPAECASAVTTFNIVDATIVVCLTTQLERKRGGGGEANDELDVCDFKLK
jgi:hypothetical protein